MIKIDKSSISVKEFVWEKSRNQQNQILLYKAYCKGEIWFLRFLDFSQINSFTKIENFSILTKKIRAKKGVLAI